MYGIETKQVQEVINARLPNEMRILAMRVLQSRSLAELRVWTCMLVGLRKNVNSRCHRETFAKTSIAMLVVHPYKLATKKSRLFGSVLIWLRPSPQDLDFES